VSRLVFIGIVMPLAMFVVGRTIFSRDRSVRPLLWMLIAAGAYSAFVSIVQFHGPAWLAWPRYIVDAPTWEKRANGVFNQPVVNGLVLIVGFLAAMLVASHGSESRIRTASATVVLVASAYAVYLTHTRAVWLAFALVLVIGAASRARFRQGYALSLAVMVIAVVVNWSTFTSADRAAGGVGSPSEVHDRLNAIATSWWAVQREPLTGWGIGRFPSVNTYHHQAWSPTVPWERGYGISSHLDVLGILVELGVIGVAMWLAVLVLVAFNLARAIRRLPPQGIGNRAFALSAALAFMALLVTGLTVDLRFFDFPNIVVWLLVGAAIGRADRIEQHPGVVHHPRALGRALAPSGQGRQ
jgi:O-antigen ligase